MSAPVPSKPSEVKDWCISNGFHPNKTLGQNFLIDRNTIDAIVASAGVGAGSRILEVGPGLGALTHALLASGAAVTAVEKDVRLAELLGESCASYGDAFRLHAADMLEVPLDELLAANFDAFVSNLPYSVGTRILLDVCRHPLAPALCVVMVQREVAERLAAKPGDEARGQAGVWVQADYGVELLRTVKPTCFWPRPEIASTVVKLVRRADALGGGATRCCFERVTKLAFMHRRKQLGAVMRQAKGELGFSDDGEVAAWLGSAGIDPRIRPEMLSDGDWRRLSAALAAKGNGGQDDCAQ